MNLDVKYRGKVATTEDVALIKALIAQYPLESRSGLSRRLCIAWNWIQPNGELRDQVCRSFLLELERAGYIQLPPRKVVPNNPLANRRKPVKVEFDCSPFNGLLSQIRPLTICQVRHSSSEKLYNSLICEYHYLGYTQPVGEHLKYLVYSADKQILGCLAFSSAPRHIASRDTYIGWTPQQRKRNLHLIAYNTRFLILPWIQVKNLASHILGQTCQRLASDWQTIYNHPVYFAETFVDTRLFAGTCYQAANWIYLGKTTGRGNNDKTNKVNRSIKAVWGYPLSKKFREELVSD